MPFPKDIPAVLELLGGFDLPTSPPVGVEGAAWTAAADAIEAAKARPSPVDQVVGFFDALAPHAAVVDEFVALPLAGCARLIFTNAWHHKGPQAAEVYDTLRGRFPDLGAD